jgi:hypothetical protein
MTLTDAIMANVYIFGPLLILSVAMAGLGIADQVQQHRRYISRNN